MAAEDFRSESGGEPKSLRERISGQAEDTIGRFADELIENPVINSALQGALGAREKVAQVQETAMAALNLPSASDVDALARRLRSISQRLEEIEDGVEKVDRRLETLTSASADAERLGERIERLDHRLEDLARDVAALRRELTPGEPISAAQTRATVPEG